MKLTPTSANLNKGSLKPEISLYKARCPPKNTGCNNDHENKITREYRGLLRI